ncbi:hypothetical protein [Kineococcus sp. SYSU DK002]|uniref:hypothetical protein n=1 Tax=Kineococcus sp. SYSU DK002 TaxID=3383123 RepID=UPI003D7CB760
MDSTTIANTGIVADALVVAARVKALPSVAVQCVTWERSHASTRVMTTGGVRLLPATGRRRHDETAYGASSSSFPSSGPSTSSPPV